MQSNIQPIKPWGNITGSGSESSSGVRVMLSPQCELQDSYLFRSLPGFASSPEGPLQPGLVLPPLILSWEEELELNDPVPVTGGLITVPREGKEGIS